MSDITVLTWDDWEALYVNGEKEASGHRGRVDRLKYVVGETIDSYNTRRVKPVGGGYPTQLSEVDMDD